jgi:hypothetical protein
MVRPKECPFCGAGEFDLFPIRNKPASFNPKHGDDLSDPLEILGVSKQEIYSEFNRQIKVPE